MRTLIEYLKYLEKFKTKYLMDNHLRIERKENLHIERKEKTQRPSDQPKRGKGGK